MAEGERNPGWTVEGMMVSISSTSGPAVAAGPVAGSTRHPLCGDWAGCCPKNQTHQAQSRTQTQWVQRRGHLCDLPLIFSAHLMFLPSLQQRISWMCYLVAPHLSCPADLCCPLPWGCSVKCPRTAAGHSHMCNLDVQGS